MIFQLRLQPVDSLPPQHIKIQQQNHYLPHIGDTVHQSSPCRLLIVVCRHRQPWLFLPNRLQLLVLLLHLHIINLTHHLRHNLR
jgi:hypothetical protein